MNQNQNHSGRQGNFENYDLISDPVRIAGALAEINRHLILVSVRLDADGPLYDAHVVRIDQEGQRLFLDGLEPAEAVPCLSPGQDLFVFATMRGIAVRFAVSVDDVLSDERDGILYACSYPEQMLYLQRRDLFRVQLPRYAQHTASIRCAEGEDIVARLIDLSVRGFCLEAKASELGDTRIGQRCRYQDLYLPENRTALSGVATLVNLRASPNPDMLYAGFTIEDMDPLTERSLMRAALYYYQREAGKTGA